MTLSAVLIMNLTASAQTTAFIYQGSLNSGGVVANGSHDFEFALFDAVSGGAQLGSTITQNSVAVTNGSISVSVDFGNQFPGASRFLEIRVRPSGGGAFTTLTPRQQITSTPYSVKSLNSDTATTATTATNATNATTATNATQLGGVAADQYVVTTDPRMTDDRAPTAGSANYVQNATMPQASSNFNVSGTGTANIFAAGTQYNIGANRVLSNPGIDNLFAGVAAGSVNTGIQNSFFGRSSGRFNTTGNSNSFFGWDSGFLNKGGFQNSFFGTDSGFSNETGSNNTGIGFGADVGANNLTFATAIGSQAIVSTSNTIVLGRALLDTVIAPRLTVSGGGPNWTTSNWKAAVGLSNATAIGWEPNPAGNAFGIGHTTGGTYFFRTRSPLGNGGQPAVVPLFIGDNDLVGIGTLNPDSTLTVNGGASKASGGTTWAIFSDERLKNIRGRFTPGLQALMKLDPIRYEYKPDNALGLKGGGDGVGFSAQAVAEVLPEAVSPSTQGYLQLNSDPILWTMLNAIKEQQGMIEKLTRQVRQLQRANTRKKAGSRR